MRLIAMGLVLLGVLAGFAILAVERGAEEQPAVATERSFALSSDPSVVVISRTSPPGFNGDKALHQVFADGRYLYERSNKAGPVKSGEKQLSFDQLRSLVAILVDGGVLDSDGEVLRRRVNQEHGSRWAVDHSTTLILQVELESYVKNGEELGPMSKELRIRDLGAMYMLSPEITELSALMEFTRRLGSYGEDHAVQTGPS